LPHTLLVAGAAGFIGANFAHHMVALGHQVVSLDKLTYAGNLENLASLTGHDRHRFQEGSINDSALLRDLLHRHRPDHVVNFAAESHVDRSIDGPAAFIDTNIAGLFTLLECVRDYCDALPDSGRAAFRFLQVSTDEVYGSIADGAFTEDSPFRPNSPYAASKAAGDGLVRSYNRTYGVPTLISNCSNNYGPYQFPEKLIPLMISKALAGQPLPVYGDGANERDWLFVGDHCTALEALLRGGEPGETYNVGSGESISNIALVERLCDLLTDIRPPAKGAYRDLIAFVEDRPGHDRRYAIDHSRISGALGWRPDTSLDDGLRLTVEWYLANERWLDNIRTGRYAGERLGHGRNAAG